MNFSPSDDIKLYAHQIRYLEQYGYRKNAAVFAEMGTGKTVMALKNIEELYLNDEVNTVLVIAPNGVQRNWIFSEIPKFLKNVEVDSYLWNHATTKKNAKEQDNFLKPRKLEGNVYSLRILAMNCEALATKKAFAFAEKFLSSSLKTMTVVDESDSFKNETALRTKNLLKLSRLCRYKRIMTGTPVTNSPVDFYSQFEFLDKNILGSPNIYCFRAEYCCLLPPSSPMMQKIFQRTGKYPQLVETDKNGNPKFKNLEKLKTKYVPHSFIVRKSECLDLPEKIYKRAFFKLSDEQIKIMELCKDQFRILDAEGNLKGLTALTALNKLSQIESGSYYSPESGELVRLPEKTEKLEILKGIVTRALSENQKIIIWCNFKFEIEDVISALSEIEVKDVVQYHGGTTNEDRANAIEEFQNGKARVFIGTAKAGGIGLTLTAASVMIYYSNNYSLKERLQSEDRAHRIGQKRNVVYFDLICKNSISEKIVDTLNRKRALANLMLESKNVSENFCEEVLKDFLRDFK